MRRALPRQSSGRKVMTMEVPHLLFLYVRAAQTTRRGYDGTFRTTQSVWKLEAEFFRITFEQKKWDRWLSVQFLSLPSG